MAAGLALATQAGEPSSRDAGPPDPSTVVARAFLNLYGYSSVQRVEIRARSAEGRELLRSAQVVRRGSEEGLNRMLVRLLGPGDLRGVGLLLLERPDFSYDAFLYQPALRRVRRITVAQRNDRFLGTEVYFEDLESKRAEQWGARLLREEALGGRAAIVLELVPEGVPSGYDRVEAWFDRELPVMLRAEFYRGGARLKEMEIDPDRIERRGAYFVPVHLTFRGADGAVTTVEIPEIDFRREIPDEVFTEAVLERSEAAFDARTEPAGGPGPLPERGK